MSNQQTAPQQPEQNNPCEGLLREIFETYRNSEIQEGLDRLMCALAESEDFGSENGLGRSNAVYFVQNLKKHFNRANVINQRLKGGENAAN